MNPNYKEPYIDETAPLAVDLYTDNVIITLHAFIEFKGYEDSLDVEINFSYDDYKVLNHFGISLDEIKEDVILQYLKQGCENYKIELDYGI